MLQKEKVVLFGGCSRRGWGGLLSKTAVSEAISGSRAVHTWFCSYCCMAGDLARADQGLFSKIYSHKRDSTSLRPLSAVFTMCYANAHPAMDMAAYLHRALSGGIGHRRYLKGYDCGPISIVRNNEERSWAPRRFSWYRAT